MNIDKIMQNLGLEKEEVMEMMDLFVESSVSDLDKLEAAVVSNNTPNIALYAHSLKGAALNFGLDEITRKAQEVELNAKSGVLEGGFEAVAALRRMLDEVVVLLR